MRNMFIKIVLCVSTVFLLFNRALAKDRGLTNTSSSPYVKLRSVDMDAVKWTDGFWADQV